MKPLFARISMMSGYEQGTHSNQGCVCVRAWNDGIIGADQALII